MITRNHQCGHVQKVCNHCLSVGCDNTNCPSCIGNGTTRICKVCGSDDVSFMEDRQYKLKARAYEQQKVAEHTERRFKALEKKAHIEYRANTRSVRELPNAGRSIRIFLTFLICYVLSQFLKYDDFNGIIGFIVGVINVIGGIAEVIVKLLIGMIQAILQSL